MFPVANIRSACSVMGITLAELERELGIGNGVIARWEYTKSSPPYDRLLAIADRFGLTVEELSTPDFPPWEIAAAIAKAQKKPDAESTGLSKKEQLLISLWGRLTSDQQDFVIAQLQGLLRYQADRDAL